RLRNAVGGGKELRCRGCLPRRPQIAGQVTDGLAGRYGTNEGIARRTVSEFLIKQRSIQGARPRPDGLGARPRRRGCDEIGSPLTDRHEAGIIGAELGLIVLSGSVIGSDMKDVADWLASIGLRGYAQRFIDNAVEFSVLRDLTEQDLKDLGVLLGHRRKILRAIAQLDGGTPAPNALASEPMTRADAERRHLTVMICDLVGSTALSARLDPEDMNAVIDAYHAACARIMLSYDGFIGDFRGDGILAYFGYPRAHEDDAERTVRAAFDIIAAISRLETRAVEPLSVRIGIASGLVMVGDLSGDSALR